MKLFIVTNHYQADFTDVLGVFSTEQKAGDCLDTYKGCNPEVGQSHFNSFDIRECELDEIIFNK